MTKSRERIGPGVAKKIALLEKSLFTARCKWQGLKAQLESANKVIEMYQKTVSELTHTLAATRGGGMTPIYPLPSWERDTAGVPIHPQANMASFAAQLDPSEAVTVTDSDATGGTPPEGAISLSGFQARLNEIWNDGDEAVDSDFIAGTAQDDTPQEEKAEKET